MSASPLQTISSVQHSQTMRSLSAPVTGNDDSRDSIERDIIPKLSDQDDDDLLSEISHIFGFFNIEPSKNTAHAFELRAPEPVSQQLSCLPATTITSDSTVSDPSVRIFSVVQRVDDLASAVHAFTDIESPREILGDRKRGRAAADPLLSYETVRDFSSEDSFHFSHLQAVSKVARKEFGVLGESGATNPFHSPCTTLSFTGFDPARSYHSGSHKTKAKGKTPRKRESRPLSRAFPAPTTAPTTTTAADLGLFLPSFEADGPSIPNSFVMKAPLFKMSAIPSTQTTPPCFSLDFGVATAHKSTDSTVA